MSKPLSEYVKEAKEKHSDLAEVMERRKRMKIQELDDLQLDRYIEEERAKLQQTAQVGIPHGQALNWVATLFAGRSPAEIQEIVNGLTSEGIDNLAMINARMNPGSFANFKSFVKEPTTTGKEIVDAVKTGAELAKTQTSSSSAVSISDITKSMAEMFKTGVELGKGQAPPPQQNTLEMFKTFHEIYLKPVLDQLASKDKENLEIRMRHMESQRIDPLEYLKSIKQASSDLGLSQTTRNEIDLRLEEMRELHDIEMAKYGFETRKWDWQKANEGKTIEQVKDLVKTVTEGPIGKAIENIGGATSDRIRSGKGNSAPLVKAQCPKCGGIFGVNPALPMVTCVHCGEQLARQQPSSQQVQESQNPQASQQEPQASEQPAQSADQQTTR